MKQLLYILFLLFLLAACRENKKDQFARLVQEWQGKEIVFPQDMAFTRFVTEQVEYRIPDAETRSLLPAIPEPEGQIDLSCLLCKRLTKRI